LIAGNREICHVSSSKIKIKPDLKVHSDLLKIEEIQPKTEENLYLD
jgi:hypothetical protein